MIKPLQHRKVKKGADDNFSIKLDREYVSSMGVIDLEPVDLTDWKFWMYIHKYVEYCPENEICKVVGYVPDAENGIVFFLTGGCKIDVPAGMYWYSVKYETPNGKTYWTRSAKYEIVESLNEYFSIYK